MKDPAPSAAGDRASVAAACVNVLRANSRAALMLGVAVITGIAALMLFPTDGPEAVNYGIRDIDLAAAGALNEVSVYLTPDNANAGMDVRIALLAYDPGPGGVTATLTNNIPKEFSPWTPNAQNNGFVAHVQFSVSGTGSNEAANDVFATAVLPAIRFFQASVRTPLNDLRIEMAIPDGGRYTWTGSSQATPQLDHSFTEWDLSGQEPTLTANGVSLAAQDRDTKLTFLSGALLGVAGGALVGAIQELRMAHEPGHRRRLRRSRPPV